MPRPRVRLDPDRARHASAFAVEAIAIDRIRPYAKNPRKNAAAVAKTAASIREFGWRQPLVVDETLTLIVGHTRLLAARHLGLDTVPVHIARGLSRAQVKAYRLADNRTGQEAEWDLALLADELADLKALDVDLTLTGFEDDEIAGLFASDDPHPPSGASGPPDETTPTRASTGEMWTLGCHRLVVGDSTDAAVRARALAEVLPALQIMDPPFDIPYTNWPLEPSARVVMLWQRGKQAILWESVQFGHSDRWGVHELVFTGGVRGWPCDWFPCTVHDTVKMWRRDDAAKRFDPDVLRDGDIRAIEDGSRPFSVQEHAGGVLTGYGGMSWGKPLVAMSLAMSYIAREDVVWDPCAGSGTSLMAAEYHGRVWRGVESQVRWADLILQRWDEAHPSRPAQRC